MKRFKKLIEIIESILKAAKEYPEIFDELEDIFSKKLDQEKNRERIDCINATYVRDIFERWMKDTNAQDFEVILMPTAIRIFKKGGFNV